MTPKPWGTNEMPWRRAVAEKATILRNSNETAQASDDTIFLVRLVFYLKAAHIRHTDLDNLAKPVLDTIFLSRNPQVSDSALTGSLFDVDDDRVFGLHLEKRQVSNEAEEGMDAMIEWQ